MLIVAFWAVMMGLLLYNEVLRPYLGGARPTRSTARPQDIWLGVFTEDDRRVGFVHTGSFPLMREGEQGARLTITADLRLPLFGFTAGVFVIGSGWVSSEHGLREFDVQLQAGPQEVRVKGNIKEGRLKAELQTVGEAIPFETAVGDFPLFSDSFGLGAANMPLLRPGQSAYVDAFDPISMSTGKAKLECTGTETIDVSGEAVETFVMEMSIGNLKTRAWVTEDEEVVRADTPLGFYLKKITAEEAYAPVEEDEKARMLRMMLVQAEGKKPYHGVERMSFRMSGLPDGESLPIDEMQSFENEEYTVRMAQAPAGDEQTTLSEVEKEAAVASDPFVQSDHEKIRAAAREIIGNEADPWRQCDLLTQWVYENLRKVSVISLPTALTVLDAREGDCNEHAVLFAALARSLGIPTRIAIGLAWSDIEQAFGYHAWDEVFVGRWTAVDPTFGQTLADATHIKLFNGGIDQWSRLLAFVGRLRLEVSAVE